MSFKNFKIFELLYKDQLEFTAHDNAFMDSQSQYSVLFFINAFISSHLKGIHDKNEIKVFKQKKKQKLVRYSEKWKTAKVANYLVDL